MKRARLIPSGSLNRTLLAAEQSWNRRDFQQCFELLERASSLDPANTRILLQLGRFYGLRYDYVSAERCFDKAIRLSPNKAQALAGAAGLCVDFAQHRLAEHYFQEALRQNCAIPETFARMAELYEHLHRLSEARETLERALHLDARCAPALLVRARLDRQAGRLAEAEAGVQSLLSAGERDIRIRAYYELGTILDRQHHYDEAMSALVQAKALLRPDAAPLLAQQQATRSYWKEMLAHISAEMLGRWSQLASDLVPQHRLALLCGHARSGTTLLEQVLDAHPDAVSIEETEIFHDDAFLPLSRAFPPGASMLTLLDGARIESLQQSRASYLRTVERYLGGTLSGRCLIDKNPSINFLIPAFARVFPETRFLVALRDPRDVCLSCFMQAHLPLSQASVSHLTLEGSVERYVHGLGLWLKLQPLIPCPWMQVRYEDVVSDLESVSRRVLDFLGLEWDDRVLRFNEHVQGKRVRSPSYADVAQPVFGTAVGRWRNYQKYFEPYLEKLEPFVKAFGYG